MEEEEKERRNEECRVCGGPSTRPTMRLLFRMNIRRGGATKISPGRTDRTDRLTDAEA